MSESDSDSISKLLEESESSPDLSTMENRSSDSDSDSDSHSDSEEATPTVVTEDIDDCEDQTDEGKYEAPKYLRQYFDQVVKEIEQIVKNNPSKESKRSSTGRNSINGRTSQCISEKQKLIAEEMLESMILRKIPQIRSKQFKYFDMFIIVPYFHSLGKLKKIIILTS